MSDLPWIVTGDFNEILFLDEKTERERNNWQTENSQVALTDIGLFDIRYAGPKFIWKGPRHDKDFIGACLDRALMSTSFSQLFPSCMYSIHL